MLALDADAQGGVVVDGYANLVSNRLAFMHHLGNPLRRKHQLRGVVQCTSPLLHPQDVVRGSAKPPDQPRHLRHVIDRVGTDRCADRDIQARFHQPPDAGDRFIEGAFAAAGIVQFRGRSIQAD